MFLKLVFLGNDILTKDEILLKNPDNLTNILQRNIASKEFVFGVILVLIFPHSDWMRRDPLLISPYSVQVRENTDQNNSEYGLFSRRQLVF